MDDKWSKTEHSLGFGESWKRFDESRHILITGDATNLKIISATYQVKNSVSCFRPTIWKKFTGTIEHLQLVAKTLESLQKNATKMHN